MRRSTSRRFTMDHYQSSSMRPEKGSNLESALSKLKHITLDEEDQRSRSSNRSITSERSRRRRGDSTGPEEALPPPIPPPSTSNGSMPPPPSYNQVMMDESRQDKLTRVNRLFERHSVVHRSIASPAGGSNVTERRSPVVSHPHHRDISVSSSYGKSYIVDNIFCR